MASHGSDEFGTDRQQRGGVPMAIPSTGNELRGRSGWFECSLRRTDVSTAIDDSSIDRAALAGAPVAGAAAFGSFRLGSDFDDDELLRIGAVRALCDVFTISAHG